MTPDRAETIALRALSWILGQDDLSGTLLGATGASAEDMRVRVNDPVFLGSVLDFLLMDDAWVMAFCDAEALPYATPGQARGALPGGSDPHWT